MRFRDPLGISMVGMSAASFLILWLPRLDVGRFGTMWMTPIPYVVMTLSILCSIILLILIIKRRRKGLWLLIGLLLAAYWPTLVLFFLVACPFLAPYPACDL